MSADDPVGGKRGLNTAEGQFEDRKQLDFTLSWLMAPLHG